MLVRYSCLPPNNTDRYGGYSPERIRLEGVERCDGAPDKPRESGGGGHYFLMLYTVESIVRPPRYLRVYIENTRIRKGLSACKG